MSLPVVKMIFAQSKNGVIGRENTMPWYLPEDLTHFRQCTQGAPVVMGRKTWDSLPTKFRPLPGRMNIVVTRSEEWQAEGAIKAVDIEDAMQKAGDEPVIWVMGGAQIYSAAAPFATYAYVTEILETYEGDTYAPELSVDEWQIVKSSMVLESSTGLKYQFHVYKRIELGLEVLKKKCKCC